MLFLSFAVLITRAGADPGGKNMGSVVSHAQLLCSGFTLAYIVRFHILQNKKHFEN